MKKYWIEVTYLYGSSCRWELWNDPDPNAEMIARDAAGASGNGYTYTRDWFEIYFDNVIFDGARKPGVKPAIEGITTVHDGKPSGIGWCAP